MGLPLICTPRFVAGCAAAATTRPTSATGWAHGSGGASSIGRVTDAPARTSRPASLRVLVYSDDATVRERVMAALGTTLHPDLPPLDYLEVATAPVVIANMDAGDIDLAILDGETAPAGGLGIARQLKDEIDPCPPIVVLIGRRDDAWLASWSRAEAAVPHPIDPMLLGREVLRLLLPDTHRRPAT